MQHVRQGQPPAVTALQQLGVCLLWDASSANHAPPVRKRVVQLGKEPRGPYRLDSWTAEKIPHLRRRYGEQSSFRLTIAMCFLWSLHCRLHIRATRLLNRRTRTIQVGGMRGRTHQQAVCCCCCCCCCCYLLHRRLF